MVRLGVELYGRLSADFTLDVRLETSALTTSIFGPSGAGKTTLLSMIAGLLEPERGRITLGDVLLLDTSNGIRLPPERRNIGFVFQDNLLFPHLNVENNLRYPGRWRAGDDERISKDKVIEVLELGRLLDRWPSELSGGEQRRVALGRALLRNPALLLMDEPFAGLDETLKSRILGYVERVVREWSIPTLYVSHNQLEIRRLAERVVVMEEGRVVDEGMTEEVLSHPDLLGRAGEQRPVNLLRVLCPDRDGDGVWHGLVGGTPLSIPDPGSASDEILISFLPNAVSVSLREPEGSSVRNHLRGIIRHIVELGDGVLVCVDVGETIWAEITREAARELGLSVGLAIICAIKARAMTPVGSNPQP